MTPLTAFTDTSKLPRSQPGEPTWEMAQFFPRQGEWSEAEYLAIDTNHLVELADGQLEILPMPTLSHQFIVAFLYEQLLAYARDHMSGKVLFAPLPVRLGPRRYREPDIVYLSKQRLANTDKYPEGAELVIEVVSGGKEDRQRDFETKRREYAEAGIPEYWIVDPESRSVTVLALDGSIYREAGVYGAGQSASSVLLDDFTVEVDAVFDSSRKR